jgi:threonine/homoserine/homoserine lactone efflux protein
MSLLGLTELTAVIVIVLLAIGGLYAGLAAWARELFTSAVAIRRLNRVAAIIMAGAAIYVIAHG